MALTPKAPNPYRRSVLSLAEDDGFEQPDVVEYLRKHVSESVVPATCSEGCEVEPDGECSHGCPSILIAAGLI